MYPEQLSSLNVSDLALRERERVDTRIIVLRCCPTQRVATHAAS
jgi:hypothetical protein